LLGAMRLRGLAGIKRASFIGLGAQVVTRYLPEDGHLQHGISSLLPCLSSNDREVIQEEIKLGGAGDDREPKCARLLDLTVVQRVRDAKRIHNAAQQDEREGGCANAEGQQNVRAEKADQGHATRGNQQGTRLPQPYRREAPRFLQAAACLAPERVPRLFHALYTHRARADRFEIDAGYWLLSYLVRLRSLRLRTMFARSGAC
jgi:hypothetical protein